MKKLSRLYLQGYKVPLDKEAPKAMTKNNKSCLRNLQFAVQELKRLKNLQCVKQVSKEDFRVILLLSVVFSNKLRLVVDTLRHINPYITKRKVKLDYLEDFSFMVRQGDFVAIDDLDSGY